MSSQHRPPVSTVAFGWSSAGHKASGYAAHTARQTSLSGWRLAAAARSAAGIGPLLVALLALTAGGCNSARDPGCVDRSDCPAGHICKTGRCEQVCEQDGDCPEGRICADSICVAGQRAQPIIEGISGNSPKPCTHRDSPIGNCIGTGFLVTGQNLTDAEFHLEPKADSSTIVATTSTPKPSGAIELVPQRPLQEGEYTLVATNQAGEDSQQIKLLKGEDGEQGPAGEGGTLYLAEPNGGSRFQVSKKAGEADRLHVTLTASNDSVALNSLTDLPATGFEGLCDDADGCTMSIAASQYPYDTSQNIFTQAPYAGPPCRVFFRQSGTQNRVHWSVSGACSVSQEIASSDQTTSIYQPYFSGVIGTEGDGNNDFPYVLGFQGLCILAETPRDVAIDSNKDAADGFHFFMLENADSGWNLSDDCNCNDSGCSGSNATACESVVKFAEDWLAQSGRTCELTVFD